MEADWGADRVLAGGARKVASKWAEELVYGESPLRHREMSASLKRELGRRVAVRDDHALRHREMPASLKHERGARQERAACPSDIESGAGAREPLGGACSRPGTTMGAGGSRSPFGAFRLTMLEIASTW